MPLGLVSRIESLRNLVRIGHGVRKVTVFAPRQGLFGARGRSPMRRGGHHRCEYRGNDAKPGQALQEMPVRAGWDI
jgi:hypothetical protein